MSEGLHFEWITKDDLRPEDWVGPLPGLVLKTQREFNRLQDVIYKKRCLMWGRKESDMNLYEIFVVYAVVGAKPIIRLPQQPFYYGRNEEEAKISSRAVELVDPSWDPEGVTIICHELGSFNVKK